MKDPETEAGEIMELQEMFPETSIMIIQSTYDRNKCSFTDTCEELLQTSTDTDDRDPRFQPKKQKATYYCELCKVELNSEDTMKAHMVRSKHMKKTLSAAQQNTAVSEDPSLRRSKFLDSLPGRPMQNPTFICKIDLSSDPNMFPGPGTSGEAWDKNQNEAVIIISDEEDDDKSADEEDDDKSAKDSELSQNISVDKLNYLKAIFPDAEHGSLMKNFPQINDDHDGTKFQNFLNECLSDPNRLSRQASAAPSVKRSRQSDDMEQDSASAIEKSSSSSKKQRRKWARVPSGGKGKGLVKSVNVNSDIGFSGGPDYFECNLCHCDLIVVTWVKCQAGCIFCTPCFTKRFHDQLSKNVTNTDCFLKCGEIFSKENLKKYLAPVFYKELVVKENELDIFKKLKISLDKVSGIIRI